MFRGVAKFETLNKPSGFGGWKCFLKRGFGACIQIILDRDDFLGLRKMNIGQILRRMSVINCLDGSIRQTIGQSGSRGRR
jgi:hypothetical protein